MPNYESFFGKYGIHPNQKNISRDDNLIDIEDDEHDDNDD